MLAIGLMESPTSEVLVEESILGWKEFELEIMRDHQGTFVVICTIENFDPCGVHTGDSITVAPQQTLSDEAYQAMRDEAMKIVEIVGVETGGANIQFAVHPKTGERVVIEMNPRVSRSSALASKATGFPIAKIAALLAVGYRLDEIKNDITKTTPSCFEPALDYVVTKIPRFAFEKFPGSKDQLGTQMRSVGEVMGIGRTLTESLMKAILSLEMNPQGIAEVVLDVQKITYPNSQRLPHLFQAFREGISITQLQEWSQIDFYFLEIIEQIIQFEKYFRESKLTPELLRQAKKNGFSDARLAAIRGVSEAEIFALRDQQGVRPGYLKVDTCAGEFKSETPYFYSSYWASKSEVEPSPVGQCLYAVIGSGPNRIGQGIEFDYSCVRGVKALKRSGARVMMINSNPETVSTDYDTADTLFFEPLTTEAVHEIFHALQPTGFFAQLGGQTPIQLAEPLVKKGWSLMGSSLEAIDLAEDRGRFSKICAELGLRAPESTLARDFATAQKFSSRVGFPLMCRPSYVLGGRRMEVVESESELASYFERHAEVIQEDRPCLIDRFLEGALEVDVDLVRGVDWVKIGGIVEHIEAAGVHSGDSMGVLPPQRMSKATLEKIEVMSIQLANRLNVVGHLNLQLAIQEDEIYVLEANPRSSRCVPFIAKATGLPLIDWGVQACLGRTKAELNLSDRHWSQMELVAVKGVVFPFKKFSDADSILGPEMKSTGESMGRGRDFPEALVKALLSSSVKLPLEGEIFLSLRDKDKEKLLPIIQELLTMGYNFSATEGTYRYLASRNIPAVHLKKVHEGRPHCVDRIRSGQVAIVINTTRGRRSIEASFDIRRACIDNGIPCLTESEAAVAFAKALDRARERKLTVYPLERG